MKRVSIIIPTRNRSELLERSISHAFAQDYPNKEVIVSNNASLDNTQFILEELKNKYPLLNIVSHQQILGLSCHWDTIIRLHSTGDYILVIPDDDILVDETYLSNAISIFYKYKSVGLVFANYYLVNKSFNRIDEINAEFEELIIKEFLFANYNKELFGIQGIGIPHLTSIFSRQAYIDSGGFDLECMCPDTYLWLKILLTYDAGFVRKKVAEYLVHDNNLSKKGTAELYYSDTLICKKISQYAQKIGKTDPDIWSTLNRLEQFFYDRFHYILKQDLSSGKFEISILKNVNIIRLCKTFFPRIVKK